MMLGSRRAKVLLGLGLGLCAGLAVALIARPADHGGPHGGRFLGLNTELRAVRPGRDAALLDLAALDTNVTQVQERLGERFALRLVTKSLPSRELVAHLMERTGTDRLMVFNEGFLAELLADLGRPADVLLGKPLPAAAAGRLLRAFPGAAEIRWLVDSPQRLRAYLALAQELDLRLRIVHEIDVGLRRGGSRDPAGLLASLAIIDAHRDRLTFVGLMGYDGHVPFAPAVFSSNQSAVERELAAVHARYTDFVGAGREAFPDLFAGPLIFNSGGSRTYFRYTDAVAPHTPVNEVAIGSGFIAPLSYGDLIERGHQPALFLATPVLKRHSRAEIPFVHDLLPWLALWDPNLEVDFVLVSGGFPGEVVSPPGLVRNPFTHREGGLHNLVSSQASLNGSARVELEVGDFVFYQPWEADGLIWCDSVLLVRQDRVVGKWRTYRGGP